MSHDINVLYLSWAIDEHSQALATDFIHEGDGGCSDDCAGDIRARYLRLWREYQRRLDPDDAR